MAETQLQSGETPRDSSSQFTSDNIITHILVMAMSLGAIAVAVLTVLSIKAAAGFPVVQAALFFIGTLGVLLLVACAHLFKPRRQVGHG